MGTVFEAEQDHPRRIVALKLIRTHLATEEMLRRFEHEALVLGRLHHPGIAQIYEAGAAPSGSGSQPYFAMELVDGVELNEYVRTHSLDLNARLALFGRICEAVQHAHEKGVIHRDLKPANILVMADGSPKVLDFGVARLTDSDVQTVTMRTDIGQLLGTLPYMSPEQAAADPDAIDSRSDVYALGVILYELLSGRMPYEIPTFLGDALRVIREAEPMRLSTLHRMYRGDIETIVAKALEKEPERRYASAHELATDVERYLRDEPIVARRPSALYQIRKFARRNKILVGGMAAVFLALVAGTTVSLLQAFRAIRAEKDARTQLGVAKDALALAERRESEARVESAKSRAIRDFLEEMLASADPGNSLDRDVKVREVLDRSAEGVDQGSFADEPEVESAVRRVLGKTYAQLGELERGEAYLRAALASAEALHPDTSDELAQTWYDLAFVLHSRGRMDEAAELAERALRFHEETPGASSELVAADLLLLGDIRYNQGRNDEGEGMSRRALEIREALFGPESPQVASALASLAFHLHERGDVKGAKELLDRAIRMLGGDPAWRLLLASALKERGRILQVLHFDGAARADWARALEVYRAAYGDDHVVVADLLDAIAGSMIGTNEAEKGEQMAREALAIRRRILGDHRDTATSLATLAAIVNQEGHAEEALSLAEESLAMRRELFGDESPAVADSLRRLGGLHLALGDLATAEPMLRKAIELWRASLGPDHPDLTAPMLDLARLLRKTGGLEEAESLNRECLRIRETRFEAADPSVLEIRDELTRTLLQREEWSEVEAFTRESLELYGKALGTWHASYANSKIQLGAALTGEGRYEEAEPILLDGWQTLSTNEALWLETKTDALACIVHLYEVWEKPDEAAYWREIAQAIR
jgi:tetratricopeptide (TPR) repeat protein